MLTCSENIELVVLGFGFVLQQLLVSNHRTSPNARVCRRRNELQFRKVLVNVLIDREDERDGWPRRG
jgi:hypothetical protein